LAALALTLVLVHRLVPLRPRVDPKLSAPLLRDSLPYALAIAVNITYFRLAMIVTSLVASAVQTGYFATSFRIVEVLIVMPPVILGAAFPILARAARDDAGRFVYATRRIFEVSLVIGALVAVCVELGADLAVNVLAGPGYEAAIPILRIQAPAICATFVAVACAYPLLSLRRHREVLLANAAALVVSVALLAALVPPFAAVGAAVATLGAEATLAVVIAVLLLRSREDVHLPLGLVPWVILASAAAMSAAFLPVPAIARVVVGAAVFGGVIVATGRFPRELLEALRTR
jgi:O-antigen/teichoic acid export membrane protein